METKMTFKCSIQRLKYCPALKFHTTHMFAGPMNQGTAQIVNFVEEISQQMLKMVLQVIKWTTLHKFCIV